MYPTNCPAQAELEEKETKEFANYTGNARDMTSLARCCRLHKGHHFYLQLSSHYVHIDNIQHTTSQLPVPSAQGYWVLDVLRTHGACCGHGRMESTGPWQEAIYDETSEFWSSFSSKIKLVCRCLREKTLKLHADQAHSFLLPKFKICLGKQARVGTTWAVRAHVCLLKLTSG